MPPSQGTGSAPDGSDSPDDSPSPEWYEERWAVLADILDVSDPQKVVSRVRTLQEMTKAGDEDEGTAFREMRDQLERLRSQNADLTNRPEGYAAQPDGTDELHPETEVLLDQLDVASLTEAQERIRSLTEQLENLYSEKETLAEAGLMSGQEALDEIDRLQNECDRLRSKRGGDSNAYSELPLLESREEKAELRRLAREIIEGLGDIGATVDGDVASSPDALPDDLLALMQTAHEQVSALRKGDRSSTRSKKIADALGIASVEEARELDRTVRRLTDRLDTLQSEKETLSKKLGVAEAGDLLDLIESLEDQLSALYEEQHHSHQHDGAEIPEDVEDILGVSNAEEARELASHVFEMNERLEKLAAAHETLAEHDLNARKAVIMINSMEAQLVDLYGATEGSQNGTQNEITAEDRSASSSSSENRTAEQSIGDILGISTPSEARELDQLVRRMSEKLNQLQDKTEKLADSDLTPETALEMIENMEAQLVDLYHDHDQASSVASQTEALEDMLGIQLPEDEDGSSTVDVLAQHIHDLIEEGRTVLSNGDDAATIRGLVDEYRSRLEVLQQERDAYANRVEQLDAIEDVLGISSIDEAQELTTLVQNLDTQLQTLYGEREKLDEVGLSSVEDAVEMIQSMEGQLRELYEEQEALQDLPDRPEQQDTFQQLEALYKEQERLKRALGVSDAEEVIEMVEDLTAQLDEVYADQSSGLEDDTGALAAKDTNDTPDASPSQVRMNLDSMRHQLEMLYEEKEMLLRRGLKSAEEATARIDDLQNQLQTAKEKHADCQERMDRLEAEFGTTNVSEIIDRAKKPSGRSHDGGGGLSTSDFASTEAANDDPFVQTAPSLLPEDTSVKLEDLPSSDLDTLPVGAIRLDDQGTIQALNEDGMQFPGLREHASRDRIVGTRLFEEVPSTSNALFLGRFKKGVEQGEMDARFPYTFVSPENQPTVYVIHLYRAGPDSPNWLLFRPAQA